MRSAPIMRRNNEKNHQPQTAWTGLQPTRSRAARQASAEASRRIFGAIMSAHPSKDSIAGRARAEGTWQEKDSRTHLQHLRCVGRSGSTTTHSPKELAGAGNGKVLAYLNQTSLGEWHVRLHLRCQNSKEKRKSILAQHRRPRAWRSAAPANDLCWVPLISRRREYVAG